MSEAISHVGSPDKQLFAYVFTDGVAARAFAATALLMPSRAASGELSYMTSAMEREQHACSSLLTRAGAALADFEPIPTRPVRGCIAMAFTARAWPLLDAPTALLMPSRAASSAT